MKFGEVHICQFPFTSGVQSKPRPALVLFDLGNDVLIYRITSVLQSGPADIPLKDWQKAGLLKPSIARLDRLVTAEKTTLGMLLGTLTNADTEDVRTRWNSIMRL